MAMNREQKRAMQKRGLAGADGSPVATRERRTPTTRPTNEPRTPIRQVFREIVAEMRKTSWPTRDETMRLAVIVFVTVVVLTLLIFGMDLGFGWLFDHLYNTTPKSTTSASAVSLIRAIS